MTKEEYRFFPARRSRKFQGRNFILLGRSGHAFPPNPNLRSSQRSCYAKKETKQTNQPTNLFIILYYSRFFNCESNKLDGVTFLTFLLLFLREKGDHCKLSFVFTLQSSINCFFFFKFLSPELLSKSYEHMNSEKILSVS